MCVCSTIPSTNFSVVNQGSAYAHDNKVSAGYTGTMESEAEFIAAYDEYADRLFRHCYFRVSDRERALDIVQDTFMKTWDKVSQGVEVQNYKAYLFRVLNNLIIDEYRKKKNVSLDALLEEEGVTEGSFEDLRAGGLEEAVSALELSIEAEKLKQAITQLPETYHQVVVMRFIDQLSPKEIAQELAESENAVSVRIHRGVKKLEQLLKLA